MCLIARPAQLIPKGTKSSFLMVRVGCGGACEAKKGGRDGAPSNVTKMKVETLSELYNKMQKFAVIMWSLKKRHFNRGQAARVTEAAGVCIFPPAES